MSPVLVPRRSADDVAATRAVLLAGLVDDALRLPEPCQPELVECYVAVIDGEPVFAADSLEDLRAQMVEAATLSYEVALTDAAAGAPVEEDGLRAALAGPAAYTAWWLAGLWVAVLRLPPPVVTDLATSSPSGGWSR